MHKSMKMDTIISLLGLKLSQNYRLIQVCIRRNKVYSIINSRYACLRHAAWQAHCAWSVHLSCGELSKIQFISLVLHESGNFI